MKNTLLLYWAPGGTVELVAKIIFQEIGHEKVEISDVASFDLTKLNEYENFIVGSATVGAENWRDTQDDNKWNEFFVKTQHFDLSTKKVAVFGLGNQILYPEHFVDALGYFKTEVEKRNGKLIGFWPTEGYDFTDSEGAADGQFFGLALDHDNESELTLPRIKKWLALLNNEMNF
ncbi:MAG: flavodoxin domain-containing protein [Bacteroidales bacterium]|nr:flavodoxin domain-containing protein [Bacteroidales bacterium]